ncbi:MAG: aldehyde dehydrogenase family protein [Anaerolineae bacterium]|nr:aldehyde dehydrogenase family protein [Anaerolineae bacterium]MDW8298267.1 aldehyde dehydrogenase family protein [Anaerolineae bacterium]
MTLASQAPVHLNGQSNEVIISTSPATGRKLGEVRVTPLSEAPVVMQRARDAQRAWFEAGLAFRLEVMRNWQESLRRNFDRLVGMVVAEQGRPPFEALTEFLACIDLLAYYRSVARRALAPTYHFVPLDPHHRHWTVRQPYGVVLVITPWNFPLMLTITPIAAALVTGNAVILKPSEYSTQVGELLARTIRESGIPEGVFQIVHGKGDLGAALIEQNPDKISFTGSTATGRKIAMAAAERLIPVTLELGAKDAALVLEDADLDRAAHGIVWGAMFNAGQACLSIERAYVMRAVAEPLMQKMKAVIEKYITVGAGESPQVTMGTLTTQAQLEIVDRQVREAVSRGARLICGGKVLEGHSGRAYAPTILTDVTPEMRLMREETFGPVLAVVPIDRPEEGVQAINALSYGLTCSVWTRNRARGIALMEQIEVGHASLNDHIITSSVPQAPWGGVKYSGYGRSRGVEGLHDMTYAKVYSAERFAPLPRELFWYPYTPFKYTLLRRFINVYYATTWRERLAALFGR